MVRIPFTRRFETKANSMVGTDRDGVTLHEQRKVEAERGGFGRISGQPWFAAVKAQRTGEEPERQRDGLMVRPATKDEKLALRKRWRRHAIKRALSPT